MKRPSSKGHILYNSISMTFLKWYYYGDGAQISNCQGLETVGEQERVRHKGISQGELYGGWSVLRLDYSSCHTNLPVIKGHRTINKHCADVNFLVLTLCFTCLRCNFLNNFTHLFIAVLGLLCCCKGFYLVAESGGYTPVVLHRLLIMVASLVTEHRL